MDYSMTLKGLNKINHIFNNKIHNNPYVETIQHQNTVTSQQTSYVHVPLRSRLSVYTILVNRT